MHNVLVPVVFLSALGVGISAGNEGGDDLWQLGYIVALIAGALVGLLGMANDNSRLIVLGFGSFIVLFLSYFATRKLRWGTYT